LLRAACTSTATTGKTENAFAAVGIYPYRPDIISDKDFEPSEITRRDNMPDENLKEIEDELQMLTLPFLSMILISIHLPHHELLIMYHQK
jgi:hypothetical protein